MSQARTIESSNLRMLPLPGRDDAGYPDAIARNRRREAEETQSFAALRDSASQSRHADKFLAVNYGANINFPAAPANYSAPQRPGGGAVSGNVQLSDEVMSVLLGGNEVGDASGQGLAAAPLPEAQQAGISAYAMVAGLFPDTRDSLFRLAS